MQVIIFLLRTYVHGILLIETFRNIFFIYIWLSINFYKRFMRFEPPISRESCVRFATLPMEPHPLPDTNVTIIFNGLANDCSFEPDEEED